MPGFLSVSRARHKFRAQTEIPEKRSGSKGRRSWTEEEKARIIKS